MVLSTLIRPAQAPAAEAPDAGVIEEARARHRRHRAFGAAVLTAALVAGGLAFGLAGAGTTPPRSAPPLRLASSLRWLTGPRLGATHLRLVVSADGPASIVDVDSGRARAIGGLDVPPRQTLWSPKLSTLTAVPGGALALVTSQACQSCAIRKADFVIGANGQARPVAQLTLNRDQYTTTEALHSTGTWVLTWPRGGHCTLQLEPSARAAMPAPCGSLSSDTPAGLLIARGDSAIVVDPQTGRVRERIPVSGPLDVLNSDLALESTAPGFPADDSFPTDLTLINLTTGSRKPLAWPSILHFSYRVLPEPHGSLVAVEFVDPAYTPGRDTIGQAADIWMLDPRTGKFTHVPGFPILESVKASAIGWTADDRLVIVAQGGAFTQPSARTVIGLWQPGQRTIRVRMLPALNGYSQFVALAG